MGNMSTNYADTRYRSMNEPTYTAPEDRGNRHTRRTYKAKHRGR